MNQDLPQTVVWELLQVVRNQFCPEAPDKWWFQHLRMFKRVVCYPAAELDRAGAALPPERYRARLMDVLNTIKRHGNTGEVRFLPGYLLKCVQEHWRHHGEEWLEEAKGLRNHAEAVLLATGKAAAPAGDAVPVMAAAYAALTGQKGGRRKRQPKVETQGELSL